MKNIFFTLTTYIVFSIFLEAQVLKKVVFEGNIDLPKSPKILRKGNHTSEGGFFLRQNKSTKFPIQSLHPAQIKNAAGQITKLTMDDQGYPSWFELKLDALPRTSEARKEYLTNILIKTLAVNESDNIQFIVTKVETDDLSIEHYHLTQILHGIEVLDGDFKLHVYPDHRLVAHGYVQPIDQNFTTPRSNVDNLDQILNKFFEEKGIKIETSFHDFLDNGIQFSKEYFWKHPERKTWYLIRLVRVIPNQAEHWELYVDTQNGEVIKSLRNICNLYYTNESHKDHSKCKTINTEEYPGPEMGFGFDLFNQRRDFGIWREGNIYYMIDASKPMFNLANSRLPNNGVGVIITLDARNSGANSNRIEFISNNSNSWTSSVAVSAHYNAGIAHDYFRSTFGRNSISNNGDNIVSVVNVTEENGLAMDNAFWNGKAIYYGNGNKAFSSLPKALDVAGHELTHGVIQNAANLIYENEPGAINESMADIFGVMMDRNDWTVGEEVVLNSHFPSGAMRSLLDPHNGGSSLNDPGWQPRHVNEQYKGTLDNGGVHINSGIPNHAFYLFVKKLSELRTESAAKSIAERVYYRALTTHLMRNSNFKELRAAIELASADLFSATPDVLPSAQMAFDMVGIIRPGTTPPPDNEIAPNPGKEFLICTDLNRNGVYLYDFTNSPLTLSNRKIYSKPSVTDNGQEIFYVGDNKRLYQIFYDSTIQKFIDFEIDDNPIYRNVTVSKDGRLLAILYNTEENKIHVYDFVTEVYKTFTIYNPTSSGGATFDVLYADQMDFDLSGQYLMYDALSVISGSGIEYWDIAFLRAFDNAENNFDDGYISKLIAKLPENTSVGNPIFSKNSPDVLAFDYIESEFFSTNYALLGANLEENKASSISDNRDRLAYASYGVKDNAIVYDSKDNLDAQSLSVKPLNANKITSSGPENVVLRNAKWGTWFALGSRKLVNIDDINSITQFDVIPNPFGEDIYLKLNSNFSQPANLKITNPIGNVVWNQKLNLSEGLNQFKIQTSHLSTGCYILSVQFQEGTKSIKLLKN